MLYAGQGKDEQMVQPFNMLISSETVVTASATLYVLDESTTGLHPRDVERLLEQLDKLAAAGHSVVVVEQDMRVMALADWVMDIGPGAGDQGGALVACGTPEHVARQRNSRTAAFLAQALSGN